MISYSELYGPQLIQYNDFKDADWVAQLVHGLRYVWLKYVSALNKYNAYIVICSTDEWTLQAFIYWGIVKFFVNNEKLNAQTRELFYLWHIQFPISNGQIFAIYIYLYLKQISGDVNIMTSKYCWGNWLI